MPVQVCGLPSPSPLLPERHVDYESSTLRSPALLCSAQGRGLSVLQTRRELGDHGDLEAHHSAIERRDTDRRDSQKL